MTRARAVLSIAALALLGLMTAHRAAMAQDKPDLRGAADAYDAGVEAHRRKDFARAAALFARADELAPDPVARLAALNSALLADDAVLGMTLADRAASPEQGDGNLRDAVKAAHDKFAARVGRLRIVCTGCAAFVDGQSVAVGQDVFVASGVRGVTLMVEGRVESRSLRIAGGEAVEVSPAPAPVVANDAPPPSFETPAPAPATTASRPHIPADAPSTGISPVWFFLGAGVATLAGGLTIASGIDVRNREEDFYRAPTDQKAADGRAAETRTYVLGGVTATAGIATAALGVFAVRWRSSRVTFVRSAHSGFTATARVAF